MAQLIHLMHGRRFSAILTPFASRYTSKPVDAVQWSRSLDGLPLILVRGLLAAFPLPPSSVVAQEGLWSEALAETYLRLELHSPSEIARKHVRLSSSATQRWFETWPASGSHIQPTRIIKSAGHLVTPFVRVPLCRLGRA
ncbi:hypothetical protein E2C01_084256 [Portunus trituberculatus]|uniref:Uncharacterized protein n=1 Tax=Portunus trituberculatus TaxID=210409 RepID=A0A5B7J5U0_PORTR|nr:hypothetical protein [Portunus trituberculatus]